jgi:hypothetical protein
MEGTNEASKKAQKNDTKNITSVKRKTQKEYLSALLTQGVWNPSIPSTFTSVVHPTRE